MITVHITIDSFLSISDDRQAAMVPRAAATAAVAQVMMKAMTSLMQVAMRRRGASVDACMVAGICVELVKNKTRALTRLGLIHGVWVVISNCLLLRRRATTVDAPSTKIFCLCSDTTCYPSLYTCPPIHCPCASVVSLGSKPVF